jgi:hypothetical protein
MKNAKLYNSPLLLSGKRSDLQLDKHKITNIRGEREIDIAYWHKRRTCFLQVSAQLRTCLLTQVFRYTPLTPHLTLNPTQYVSHMH